MFLIGTLYCKHYIKLKKEKNVVPKINAQTQNATIGVPMLIFYVHKVYKLSITPFCINLHYPVLYKFSITCFGYLGWMWILLCMELAYILDLTVKYQKLFAGVHHIFQFSLILWFSMIAFFLNQCKFIICLLFISKWGFPSFCSLQLVGGVDMMAQAISLAKRPHVIVHILITFPIFY